MPLASEDLISVYLDEEGLDKNTRQQKLAALFRKLQPSRPVIVLDRDALPDSEQRDYDRIVEGPIKTAVKSARDQLKQSRAENPGAKLSVLWIINNGYTSLDHEALRKLVAQRVRNDSSEIDGVVVSGCYFHSDTFDSYFLWPIHYDLIKLKNPFRAFERLKGAWNELANKHMTELMQCPPENQETKGPIIDIQFNVGSVTFVKPTPPIGTPSEFFFGGRPRKNSSGIETRPPVATVFGELTLAEWTRFRHAEPTTPELGSSYEDWRRERAEATNTGTILRPLVPLTVTFDGWQKWSSSRPKDIGFTVHNYAHEMFNARLHELVRTSRELKSQKVRPSRYMLVRTEEIGQDRANDVSHAAITSELENGDQRYIEVFANQRIFHEHALVLACAYALVHDVDIVMWQKDRRYAWT